MVLQRSGATTNLEWDPPELRRAVRVELEVGPEEEDVGAQPDRLVAAVLLLLLLHVPSLQCCGQAGRDVPAVGSAEVPARRGGLGRPWPLSVRVRCDRILTTVAVPPLGSRCPGFGGGGGSRGGHGSFQKKIVQFSRTWIAEYFLTT